jgi:imidazolonepropionase-like amidohydrolase
VRRALLTFAPLLLAGATFAGDGDVALQAGRIYLSATDVLEGGTILVQDGKIVAIGVEVPVPAGVRVVDYGPDVVLAPGLVCADSSYGSSIAAERTAELDVRAVDNFDPYTEMFDALRAGVTTVYMAPARGRLLAGLGAVVKTGGEADSGRVLAEVSLLQGAITAEARRTPGYWEIPVPATVDVGLGVERPQLPRSTMGAVIALRELVALASGDASLEEEYGPTVGPALKAQIAGGTRWRIRADSPAEVRALLGFFGEAKLPLIIDGARGADAELAKDLAGAGVPVVCWAHTLGGADFGKSADAAGPNHALVSTLVAAGVEVVIAATRPGDLRLNASLAQRGGGLDQEAAFHAVTLAAAELLGVADRVGSLAVGKDADIVAFTGPPLDLASQVRAAWIGGELVHEGKDGPVVIEVEELHMGDGHVLRPGQLLMRGGRIQEVGERVAHPSGTVVVRGAAAMPGMVDALGHLGLEGSRKRFSTRFDLARLVEPADPVDRRVARAGVTTVNLGGRDATGQTMVYKPAGENPREMVVDSGAAIRLTWSNAIPSARGTDMRKTLAKAKEYMDKWAKYETELANWKPAPPEPPKEEEAEEDEDEEEDEEEEKKKKKGKQPPRPVTGEWTGTGKSGDVERVGRVRLLERDLVLEGTARGEGFDDLWILSGTREEYSVSLTGTSPAGDISMALELEDDKLTGTATHDGHEIAVELTQTSDVYPVAGRPVRARPETPEAPKGKPKPPGIDAELEPIRKATQGKGAVFVTATSSRDAIEAVEACNAYGIKPVIWTGDAAAGAASRLKGRVAGAIVRRSGAIWSEWGVPVAFYSGAEEGAGELSLHAATAIAGGMSPVAALRALTSDAATMLGVGGRIGKLLPGYDADVLLLDGSPLDVSSTVLRTWVDGEEIE